MQLSRSPLAPLAHAQHKAIAAEQRVEIDIRNANRAPRLPRLLLKTFHMPGALTVERSAVRSAVVRFADGAAEVYVEIDGILSRSETIDLRTAWENSQSTIFWRRFVVAISKLDGYDCAGLILLRQMYQQGVVFSAPTPRSLLFLKEIAREPRGLNNICGYWPIRATERKI